MCVYLITQLVKIFACLGYHSLFDWYRNLDLLLSQFLCMRHVSLMIACALRAVDNVHIEDKMFEFPQGNNN